MSIHVPATQSAIKSIQRYVLRRNADKPLAHYFAGSFGARSNDRSNRLCEVDPDWGDIHGCDFPAMDIVVSTCGSHSASMRNVSMVLKVGGALVLPFGQGPNREDQLARDGYRLLGSVAVDVPSWSTQHPDYPNARRYNRDPERLVSVYRRVR
jgi:hypothetical protein